MPKEANKDRQMAAHLVKSGYPHGRTKTSTHSPHPPNTKDVGSAAYRRRHAK